MAGEAVDHGVEHAAPAAQAGLPQFDPAYFAGQVFWLAIAFGLLYWVLSRALLPKVGGVIKARADKLKADTEAARSANDAAQQAMTDFERSLASARAEARAKADAVRQAASAARKEAEAKADADLGARLAAAETKLAAARAEGLASARAVAAETAQAIVAKLTGLTVAPDAAASAAET